jgi:predicted metal-binding membrane protein
VEQHAPAGATNAARVPLVVVVVILHAQQGVVVGCGWATMVVVVVVGPGGIGVV